MTNTAGLTQEKETLFITLRAKALDNRLEKPILGDKAAEELLAALQPDMQKFEASWGQELIVIRARMYDDWLRSFLDAHPDAVVLYLGCGLDTRVLRIDPPPSVSWYDVDYPEVIGLRQRFFKPRAGYEMIASSILEPSWLESVPAGRPTFILAEGVLEYLLPSDVSALLARLTARFTSGSIAFDVMNSFAVSKGRQQLDETTGAVHKWAVDDLAAVDAMLPGAQRVTVTSPFASQYVRLAPFKVRVMAFIVRSLPKTKGMLQLLMYRF